MSVWKYRKLEPQHIRGICILCNKNPQTSRGKNKFKALCNACSTLVHRSKYSYRSAKLSSCEKCGFIPEHDCQLDVDHIDGNHKNNELSNLQTLCANCHRLKTHINKEYTNRTNSNGI